ncbi:hypothetical protein GRF29_216g440421, partial [Pseudopithomyces chartarum]
AAPTIETSTTKWSEYTNPILPGWNSDPSCVFVKEFDNTLFCTTSSFLAYPGIPVYASKDFTSWKLASNAIARPDQLPELGESGGGPGPQSEGIWASTIRYRDGTFYLITSYINQRKWDPKLILFTTKDPFKDGWHGPIRLQNPGHDIDPDLFWDQDGTPYVSVAAGISITPMDLTTGAPLGATFKVWNGTGDRNPEGPHLYRKDNWYYLLIGEGGTETNHSVTMARSRTLRGPYEGYDKNPVLTAKGTENYFQTVGHADLFQDAAGNWWGVALATRSGPEWVNYPMGRETVLVPVRWEEGEFPVFETHIDLSVVHRKINSGDKKLVPHLKLSVESSGKPDESVPETSVVPIPQSWYGHPVRLLVEAIDEYKYAFSAASAANPAHVKQLGYRNATIVSGGSGPFTGTIIGVFATKNGNEEEKAPAYVSRWRYTPVAQAVEEGKYVHVGH